MEFIRNNWIWLAVAGGLITMHFMGHGGRRHGWRNRESGAGDENVSDPGCGAVEATSPWLLNRQDSMTKTSGIGDKSCQNTNNMLDIRQRRKARQATAAAAPTAMKRWV